MNCNESRPLLDLLCDGTLEHKDSALVLDHVKSCVACEQQWSAQEKLHAMFRTERHKLTIPANLTERISTCLKHEERAERSRVFSGYRTALTVSGLTVVAAALLLIFIPYNRKFDSDTLEHDYSAQSLIGDLAADVGAVSVGNKQELTQQLGYELRYLHLPQWKMSKIALYRAKHPNKALARFDFVKVGASGPLRLTCYQGLKGVIKVGAGRPEDLAGRKVTFGQSGRYQFALWSANDRDYLFISDMPSADLRELVTSS